MNAARKVKLNSVQFAEQRLKNVNPVFSQCKSFLYTLLAYIENQQLNNRINISVQRGYKKLSEAGTIFYFLEDAFAVFDKISNSPR